MIWRTFQGWHDLLQKLAGLHKCQKTACRTLHRLVESYGVTLPLRFHAVSITVRKLKPVRVVEAWWPFFSMRTWAEYLLANYPRVLLGGSLLQDHHLWRPMLQEFWDSYQLYDPDHPVFASDYDRSCLVPWAFHGDEGRGQARIPFLTLSWQPLVGHRGLNSCNDSSCPVLIFALI